MLSAAQSRSAADDTVTVRRLAVDTDLPDSVVRPVVLRLAAGGVLAALPRDTVRGTQHYVLQQTPVADAAVRLAAAALARPALPPGAPIALQGHRT